MDPSRVRLGMTSSWALVAVLVASVTVMVSAAAAAPKRIGYARLTHACPPPQTGSATCFAVVRQPVAASASADSGVHPYIAGAGDASSGPSGGLTPAELATAYGYDPAGGSGQTVAVVDAYDDPKIEEDLASFDSHYGLGECTKANGCFRKVDQEGSESPGALPRQDESGWSQEISLDVEMVRAVCRGCKILLVEADGADDEDLARAVNEAVALGATEVSNSYGGPELGLDAEERAAYNHPGVVITAAGGDYGYDNWNDLLLEIEPPAMPNAPASLPSVVSVGGTSLELSESGTRTNETVWNDDGPYDDNELGAGYVTTSGCSTLFLAQPWQQEAAGFSSAGCGDKRLSVDVSADGDPLTGFDLYDNFNYCTSEIECSHEEVQKEIERYGGWETFGGTSLGAPLIASLYALAGGANGLKYPALSLYGHLGDASALYDVTEGGDGYCDGESALLCGKPNTEFGFVLDCEGSSACDARPGYDGPSGVGTPNGLAAFKPLLPTAVITPPSSAHPEIPVVFSASRSTDPYPGGSVTSYSWNWGDGSATSSGVAPTHTYAVPGEYTVTLTVTDSYGLASLPVTQVVNVVPRTAKELKEEEEAAAKKKAEEEAAVKKKAEEEAAAKKQAEEEAVARKKTEEAAAKKKAEKEAAAVQEAEEEAAANLKKAKEEAVAKKTAEELTVAIKKLEEEAAALAAKHRQEEEAAKIQVLGIQEASPDVALASKPLRANASGVVTIKISCPVGDAKCVGTLTLRTQKAVTSTVAGKPKAKPVVLTFGSATFTIAGGKVVAVVLHLSAKARALLGRLHALGVRVTIVAHNPAGASHTGQAITTLLAPKASHSGH
jgi:PKD repeat protein